MRLCDSEWAQIDYTTAAQVLVNRNASLMPKSYKVPQFYSRRETADPEIARVDPHQQSRPIINCGTVIVDGSPIGRSHFAEHGARTGHDVRNAKAIPDLDQFAAGYHGLAT